MKGGGENRKKTITAGVLGAVALCCVIYAYEALFGGGPAVTLTPAVAPTNTGSTEASPVAATTAKVAATTAPVAAPSSALGVAPGVAAKKMASTSSSLDPTLDEAAMLRTESLVYSGTGRNIFSATYTPPPVVMPTNVPKPRPGPPPPPPPAPVYVPPPPPPIALKFFGTAEMGKGARQAFLLSGEDVYLASQGDIVARKYKIVSISATSIQVEDLANNNTQTLPLQTN